MNINEIETLIKKINVINKLENKIIFTCKSINNVLYNGKNTITINLYYDFYISNSMKSNILIYGDKISKNYHIIITYHQFYVSEESEIYKFLIKNNYFEKEYLTEYSSTIDNIQSLYDLLILI